MLSFMDCVIGLACISDEFLCKLLSRNGCVLFCAGKRHKSCVSASRKYFFGNADTSQLLSRNYPADNDIPALPIHKLHSRNGMDRKSDYRCNGINYTSGGHVSGYSSNIYGTSQRGALPQLHKAVYSGGSINFKGESK